LTVAQGLSRDASRAVNWKLLEARSVLGGRLCNDPSGHLIDLGGAWIWPQHQPNIRRFVSGEGTNSIQTFLQPDEDPSFGTTRIVGGAYKLIQVIADNLLPTRRLQLSSPVSSCTRVSLEDGTEIVRVGVGSQPNNDGTPKNSAESFMYARRVVLAVPPKVLLQNVTFDPPLTKAKQKSMAACNTWMAGVTKVALIYPSRFWHVRASNASFSKTSDAPGPAFQMYDGSTADGSVYALTFFCHVPPGSGRIELEDSALADAAATQICDYWKRLHQPYFREAMGYTSFCVQRWPSTRYISDDPNPQQVNSHPEPDATLSHPEWDGLLQFASSETDESSPGMMEGAVGSAERVLESLWNYF
jgi:monoamine oxidase